MEISKKNFIWNLIGVSFNAFTSLFFLIIINRLNNEEIGGMFSYSFSLACLFYIMALYYNRTFQVSDYKKVYSDDLCITMRLISFIISIILIGVFSIINSFNLFKMSLIILLMLYKGLEAVADCYHAFIQKHEQLYYVGMSLFYKAIFGILFFFIIDLLTKNILLSVLSVVIVNLIGLIIDIIKYRKLVKKKYTFTLLNIQKLIKETLPIFIFSFLIIFLNNSQKYISIYFIDDYFQNILGILIMPATMLALCGQYLISPYLTKLTKLYNESKIVSFKKILNKLLVVFLIISFIILIVAYLFGIPVLNILYSVQLDDYKICFIYIIIGAIFYAISTIISSCLTIIKRNKEQLLIFLISSIVSLISTYLLMKQYGLFGASYSYLLTMFIHCLLSLSAIKYFLKQR